MPTTLASRGGHHRRGVGRQTARCYRLDRRITQQRETATGYDFYLVLNARQFEALQAAVSTAFLLAGKIVFTHRHSDKEGKRLKRAQNTRYQLKKVLEAIEQMMTTELYEWKEDKQLPLTKCATCSKRTHGLTQIETEN